MSKPRSKKVAPKAGSRGKATAHTGKPPAPAVPAPEELEAAPAEAEVSPGALFGARVRDLMKDKGLSPSELAKKTGLDRTELDDTLNDRREPRPEEIGKIATGLGLNPLKLIAGVRLPASLLQFFERLEDLLENVLEAGAQRDEAMAKLEAALRDLKEERTRLRAKIRSLEEQLEAEQQALAAVKAESAERERVLADRIVELERALDLKSAELARCEATCASQATKIEQLEQQLANLQARLRNEGGRLFVSALLGGTVGLIAGTGIASSRDDD